MRNRFIIFALAFIISLSVATAKWDNTTGPTGASSSCLLRVNNHLWYFGTFGGGLYRSTGVGSAWEYVDDPSTTATPKGLNEIDGTLWLSSLLDGVSISTDNGYSWTTKKNGLGSNTAWGCFKVDGRIYVITSSGMYYTTDNGDNWTICSETTRGLEIYSFLHFGSRFVIGTNSRGVYTSDDGGATWTQNAQIGDGKAIPGMITLDGKIYAAAGHGGVYVSADSGTTWTQNSVGLETSSLNNIVISGSRFFASSREGLYYSDDTCKTWIKFTEPELKKNNWFVQAMDEYVIAGSQFEGLLFSTNNGTSWAKWNDGVHNLNVNSFIESNGKTLAGMSIMGVSSTTDNGASWANTRTGLPNYPVVALGKNNDELVASVYSYGLYYSGNGGQSWAMRSDTLLLQNTYAIIHSSLINAIFAGTSQEGVFMSRDNGITWEDVNGELQDKSIRQFYEKDGKYYMATTYGVYKIQFTIASGVQWSILSPEVFEIGTNSIDISGSHIFVATDEGMAVSHDDGATWTKIYDYFFGGAVNYVTTIGSTQFACTARGGVFVSNDNGVSWHPSNDGLYTLTTRIAQQSGDYVLLGTEGYGIFRAPLTDFVSAEDDATGNAISAYPQPCEGFVNISAVGANAPSVLVTIVNTIGETVSKQKIAPTSAGSITIDTKSIPSGAYIALVSDGAKLIKSVKFVKAK